MPLVWGIYGSRHARAPVGCQGSCRLPARRVGQRGGSTGPKTSRSWSWELSLQPAKVLDRSTTTGAFEQSSEPEGLGGGELVWLGQRAAWGALHHDWTT